MSQTTTGTAAGESAATATTQTTQATPATQATQATPATPATPAFRVHIGASAEQIWEAITSPGWTARYGYRTENEIDLRPGGRFRALANEGMLACGSPEVVVEGEVLEVDAPHRLAQTWRMLFEPAQAAEPLTTITYEIEPAGGGVHRMTVVHELSGAPVHTRLVSGETFPDAGGGWPFILSDPKSRLETGAAMAQGRAPESDPGPSGRTGDPAHARADRDPPRRGKDARPRSAVRSPGRTADRSRPVGRTDGRPGPGRPLRECIPTR